MLLSSLSALIWSPPTFCLLLAAGLYFTWKLKIIQIRGLAAGLRFAVHSDKKNKGQGSISPFQSLMTSLSSTIGTGNIVGVVSAIVIGGPGAVFWLWLAALLLMTIKYAEGLLGVSYRHGSLGGPMYYLRDGCHCPRLASVYAIICIVSGFGIGNMVQSNAIGAAVRNLTGLPTLLTGALLLIAVALILFGGIRRIGALAGVLTPFMACFYLLGCLLFLFLNAERLPSALSLIVTSAFTGTRAVAGGFAGATVMTALRSGVSRGIFANEASLGNGAMAAAAARTDSGVRQGLVAMTGTFLSTFLVCTATALVIVVSGVYQSAGAVAVNGAALMTQALDTALPPNLGGLIVNIGLILFAFTSVIGWSYYGECSCRYLGFPIPLYRMAYVFAVLPGTILKSDSIWYLSDCFNGLMVLLNVIAILLLRREVVASTRRELDTLLKDH